MGYAFGRLTLDAGYQYVHLVGASSSAPGYEGRYDGSAHLASVTAGYRF